MRNIVCLFLLSLSFTVFAQDDMPDYRSKKDNFSKVQEKDIKSDAATFTMAGIDESIGKTLLTALPITGSGADFIQFEGSNIKVTIKAAPFDAAKHKMGYYEKYLLRIDNKPYYGNYGSVPKTSVQSVTVMDGKDTITIPPAAYFDLYNPAFTYAEGGVNKSHDGVYFSADHRKMYVYMLSRDAQGSYEVTWVIQDKKYLRRIVDFGFLK